MTVPHQDRSSSTRGGISSTLQAILQFLEGGMESIAAPIPLPEAIIQLLSGSERHFRRARSPDSVIRYVEILIAEGPDSVSSRDCSRCRQCCPVLFIAKLGADERITVSTAAYCMDCYTAMAHVKA